MSSGMTGGTSLQQPHSLVQLEAGAYHPLDLMQPLASGLRAITHQSNAT